MKRRHAWITAGVVTLTFITATLAAMANTGLLSVNRPIRRVGRLTPGAITNPSAPPTATAKIVVRYEDVYVTTPDDSSGTDTPQASPAAKPTKRTGAKTSATNSPNTRSTADAKVNVQSRPKTSMESTDDGRQGVSAGDHSDD